MGPRTWRCSARVQRRAASLTRRPSTRATPKRARRGAKGPREVTIWRTVALSPSACCGHV
eukprot:2224670-Prymnesium_polylepis.1